MSARPIKYFDRYLNASQEEAVYGEWALRLVYENRIGRLIGLPVVARPFFSKIFGWYMRRPASRAKIRPFIEQYRLDPGEFKDPIEQFDSFNAFFCRQLRPGSRPIDPDPNAIVFPADGRHLGWQEIGREQQVFVKGQKWDLDGLLNGNRELISRFDRCTLILSRLCPVDYHHFHFPAPGCQIEQHWHGNRLFSVSPIALRHKLSCLWENKRCVSLIRSDQVGDYCQIEIGATNVGTIRYNPQEAGQPVNKGDPKGWFEFGGSSVITLFQNNRVKLANDLVRLTNEGMELYARVGDRMGVKA